MTTKKTPVRKPPALDGATLEMRDLGHGTEIRAVYPDGSYVTVAWCSDAWRRGTIPGNTIAAWLVGAVAATE